MTTTRIPQHPDITAAQKLLADNATDEMNSTIQMLIDTGRAAWRLDPFVENVVGLVDTADKPMRSVDARQTAWLIVYLDDDRKDGDWETSEAFDTEYDHWV